MEKTQLNIASTGLIYTPGLFKYIIEGVMPFQKKKAKELLAALGIPAEFIPAIIKGKYEKKIEGETLILIL